MKVELSREEAFAAIRAIAEATAALRAELDVARADADRAEGDLPAELRALRAELEIVETLRKSANTEIGRLAAKLETARAALETNGAEQSRLYALGTERGRAVAFEEAARVDRLNHGIPAADAAEVRAAIRALAPLDPALCVVPVCHICGSSDAVLTERVGICSRGHRLSQLDPALCVVERDVLKALSGEHEYSAMDSTYHRPECRKCAALKALEEGR